MTAQRGYQPPHERPTAPDAVQLATILRGVQTNLSLLGGQMQSYGTRLEMLETALGSVASELGRLCTLVQGVPPAGPVPRLRRPSLWRSISIRTAGELATGKAVWWVVGTLGAAAVAIAAELLIRAAMGHHP